MAPEDFQRRVLEVEQGSGLRIYVNSEENYAPPERLPRRCDLLAFGAQLSQALVQHEERHG